MEQHNGFIMGFSFASTLSAGLALLFSGWVRRGGCLAQIVCAPSILLPHSRKVPLIFPNGSGCVFPVRTVFSVFVDGFAKHVVLF